MTGEVVFLVCLVKRLEVSLSVKAVDIHGNFIDYILSNNRRVVVQQKDTG